MPLDHFDFCTSSPQGGTDAKYIIAPTGGDHEIVFDSSVTHKTLGTSKRACMNLTRDDARALAECLIAAADREDELHKEAVPTYTPPGGFQVGERVLVQTAGYRKPNSTGQEPRCAVTPGVVTEPKTGREDDTKYVWVQFDGETTPPGGWYVSSVKPNPFTPNPF